MIFKALIATAAASLAFASAADAATFVSTRTIGTGSVDLSITTDNTVGTLTAANIVAYTIKLVNTDASFTLTENNSAKLFYGNGLSASATSLFFDFDTTGVALFQAPTIGSGETFYCLQGGTANCFGGSSAEAVEANTDYIFPRAARVGTQVIASATGAVPEPASWAMMILGMGAVGYSLRRAKRRSDVKFDAKIKRMTAGALA